MSSLPDGLSENPLAGVAALGSDTGVAGVKKLRQRRKKQGRRKSWHVRASDDEAAIIVERATACGVTVPRFLVETVVGEDDWTAPQRRAVTVVLFAARRKMSGAVTNLNQLTRWANTNEALPDGLEECIEELRESIEGLDEVIEGLKR